MGWFEDRFTYSERKTELCCPVCSGKFWLPPSKAGRYKRCSPECIEAHAEAEAALAHLEGVIRTQAILLKEGKVAA